MAPFAEVMGTVAEVNCDTAAKETLPLDVLGTVVVTESVTRTKGLKLAILAQKILFGGRFLKA